MLNAGAYIDKTHLIAVKCSSIFCFSILYYACVKKKTVAHKNFDCLMRLFNMCFVCLKEPSHLDDSFEVL